MSVLRAKRLKKKYGKRWVVNGVSLYVESGEIVGLLGPNGAGKTTTFHMLVGSIKPTQGRIFLDDHEITGYPIYWRARLGITYLPQEPSVFRNLTVKENLMAIAEFMPLKKEERENLVWNILFELGLVEIANQKASTLSGGERRKTEIARALVASPNFLLLDEPFAGVDPKAVSELKRIILSLKKKGIGVIITDHNVRETLPLTDRSYLIYKGKILIQGPPQKIIENIEARRVFLGEDFKL